MENPFANANASPHQGPLNTLDPRHGPLNTPTVQIQDDEMIVDSGADELQPEEPRRYKVPGTKWF